MYSSFWVCSTVYVHIKKKCWNIFLNKYWYICILETSIFWFVLRSFFSRIHICGISFLISQHFIFIYIWRQYCFKCILRSLCLSECYLKKHGAIKMSVTWLLICACLYCTCKLLSYKNDGQICLLILFSAYSV